MGGFLHDAGDDDGKQGRDRAMRMMEENEAAMCGGRLGCVSKECDGQDETAVCGDGR
jgi:hypothetical protein